MLRAIGAPSPQGIYSFSNWSQGGTATQTFATPVNDVTYTANFTAGTIITLDPIADAYVNSGKNANNNFGSATSLIDQTNSSPNKSYETFLKFDISAISANVSSAILRVNGRLNNTQTPSIAVEAHNVTNTSWLENTITWNNKPAVQAAILATANVNSTTNQYYQWDLTSLIASLRSAGINSVTIKLINTNSTNNQVIFNSKEAASSRPELVITDEGSARAALITKNENPVIEMGVDVYPNPVKGVLNVRTNSGHATLKLYDASGRIVRQQQVSGKTVQQVPVGYLKNGLYLLKIENATGSTTKKIVIQN